MNKERRKENISFIFTTILLFFTNLCICLTHFLLVTDLPAAPVLFVFNWDVTSVQNFKYQLCCRHRTRNLKEEPDRCLKLILSKAGTTVSKSQFVVVVLKCMCMRGERGTKLQHWCCFVSSGELPVYLHMLLCRLILFFKVHCTDEVAIAFASLVRLAHTNIARKDQTDDTNQTQKIQFPNWNMERDMGNIGSWQKG